MASAEHSRPDDLSDDRHSEIRALLRRAPGDADSTPSLSSAQAHVTQVSFGDLRAEFNSEVQLLPQHRLVVVARGRLLVGTGDCVQPLEPKGCALVPRGNGYAESVPEDSTCQRFVIDFADPSLELVDPLFVEDSARRLLELAQWLLLESEASFSGFKEFCSQTLRLMLCELHRLVIDDASAIEKQLRNYVLRHLDEAISLADLAQHVGTSRFHLCRLYRRQTGESPMHAVRRIRLEMARDILRSTNLPLREIAQRVGLRSEQHLSRLLRVEFGAGAKAIRSGC